MWYCFNIFATFFCPEYHADPLGSPDRDVRRSAGVLCSMLGRLRLLPGPAVLPQEEEISSPYQTGQSLGLKHTLACFCHILYQRLVIDHQASINFCFFSV